jgi:hypothetical protein
VTILRRETERFEPQPSDTVWDNGFRQITTSVKPIKTPEAMRNLKLRVPLAPLWVAMFEAIGATPVSRLSQWVVPGAVEGERFPQERQGEVLARGLGAGPEVHWRHRLAVRVQGRLRSCFVEILE